MRACRHCGGPVPSSRAWFCGVTCRKRAFRRRRAGIPEDAYTTGAQRGRVALGVFTRAERLAALLGARPL